MSIPRACELGHLFYIKLQTTKNHGNHGGDSCSGMGWASLNNGDIKRRTLRYLSFGRIMKECHQRQPLMNRTADKNFGSRHGCHPSALRLQRLVSFKPMPSSPLDPKTGISGERLTLYLTVFDALIHNTGDDRSCVS